MLQFGSEKDPEDLTYKIFCKVKFVKKYYIDPYDDKQYTDEVALLIPRLDAGEIVGFLNAWLPSERRAENKDENEKGWEIVMLMGYPINAPCRGYVRRAHPDYPDGPHIFVMTVGVKEILKSQFKKDLWNFLKFKNGRELTIEVQPQSKDHVADDAPNIGRKGIDL